jgi:hypothetical protein
VSPIGITDEKGQDDTNDLTPSLMTSQPRSSQEGQRNTIMKNVSTGNNYENQRLPGLLSCGFL